MLGPDVFVVCPRPGGDARSISLGHRRRVRAGLRWPSIAAGSNKTAWVLVLVVSLVLGIGFLFGGYYLLAVRHKVHQQTRLL